MGTATKLASVALAPETGGASLAGAAVGSAVGKGVSKGAKALGPRRGKSTAGMKMLAGEFLICIVLVALASKGNTTNTQGQTGSATATGGGQFMVQGTAMVGVFLALGLFGAIAPSMAKFAAGIGGLVTMALTINYAPNLSALVSSISAGKAPATQPYTAATPTATPVIYQPAVTQGTGSGTLANSANTQTVTTDGQAPNSDGSNISGFNSGIGGVQAGLGGGRYGT